MEKRISTLANPQPSYQRQYSSNGISIVAAQPTIHPVAVPNTPMTPLILDDKLVTTKDVNTQSSESLHTQADYFGTLPRHGHNRI
jgi:hypothetical protein